MAWPVVTQLLAMEAPQRRRWISKLSKPLKYKLLYTWRAWARDNQVLPDDPFWFCWLILAGRGFGKTRTGAETVREWVFGEEMKRLLQKEKRVAIVGKTASDVRDVMIQGESGLLAVHAPWERPKYYPSKRLLVWPNKVIAQTFSGDEPDQLRGPQFAKGWVDEPAKFKYLQETWDNLELAMRLGRHPQLVATGTPRPVPLLRKLVKDDKVLVTKGSTFDNRANLAESFLDRITKQYVGTRLGRQELEAELLFELPGSLWTYDGIEKYRLTREDMRRRELLDKDDIWHLDRIVIGMDPSGTSDEETSNEAGLVACGRAGEHSYTLDDESGVYSPNEWAAKAVQMYERFGADAIVAEVNNGADMVEALIRNVSQTVNVKKVRASRGKAKRAAPVSALMEQGRDHHVGMFAEMEDQMCATTDEEYTGPGSPDRMDAKVWATTDLMLGDGPWAFSTLGI
jgi:phage terminase large subunit-like protein